MCLKLDASWNPTVGMLGRAMSLNAGHLLGSMSGLAVDVLLVIITILLIH